MITKSRTSMNYNQCRSDNYLSYAVVSQRTVPDRLWHSYCCYPDSFRTTLASRQMVEGLLGGF